MICAASQIRVIACEQKLLKCPWLTESFLRVTSLWLVAFLVSRHSANMLLFRFDFVSKNLKTSLFLLGCSPVSSDMAVVLAVNLDEGQFHVHLT